MTTSNTELAALITAARHWAKGLEPKFHTVAGILDRLADALESKAEPVAKVRIHKAGGNAGIAWSAAPINDYDSLPPMPDGALLYAAPVQPEKDERKPLTDEQIDAAFDASDGTRVSAARAIEAAHGIGSSTEGGV